MTAAPTLLVLGGGGFASPPGDPALDELVLELTGRPDPRVLFLPTASGDAGEQVARFHAAFAGWPVRREVLSLFRLRDLRVPLHRLILGQDAIYVGGGSLRNLLALWREHELDILLREAWEAGVVLAGLSAGAMCWFDGGVTMSAGQPEVVEGLGFVRGSLSVHRDSKPERLPVYREAVAAGALPPGWALDDGAALLLRAGEGPRVISAQAGGRSSASSRGTRASSSPRSPPRRSPRTPAARDPALDELRAVREMHRARASR